MNLFKRLFGTLLAIAMVLSLATVSHAQDYDWRTVLSESVKVQMVINSEFEFSKERVVPLHFSMGIPFSEGELVTQTRFPQTQGNVGEMRFRTPDGLLLEFITISLGTINGDTEEDRLSGIFGTIESQVYPSITPPESANILGGRKVEIAGRPAVEFVSLFDHPELGAIAARIVGVIAPNDTHVIFIVQQSLRDQMNLAGLEELSKTFGGTMLSSLTFQAYRNDAGELISF